ncbi:galactose-binding domain-like protein [Fimicolochytrium jonesii]|uniref:galactose-binding domain-like protein n=1 Tax=Fimicolochytrium jonesii TaxID=1396493 RepID=UPI0022FF17C3|nr:galactose-binding domain-like protein [Fimicolochytrium jonesii]KAI8817995.1 galactose-binding domain-like protein [Fimicolochytrium jonesii]
MTTPPEHPYSTLTNLSCASLRTHILFATDDFFAPAELFLNPSPPAFDPTTFTPFGKQMDGWETRRKRTAGHDWCIIQLGLPGMIHGFEIDTAFFTGNQAPGISVQAAAFKPGEGGVSSLVRRSEIGTACTSSELQIAESVGSDGWEELVPYTPLGPGYEATRYHYVESGNKRARFTHLRVNLFPDGGVARFRAYGVVSKDWEAVGRGEVVDLAHVENGGRAVSFSNAHYGHPRNLIAPGRSLTMAGGWETARNPDRPRIYQHDPQTGQLIIPGKHWAILALGHAGNVAEVEVDTHLFKGNFPESVVVEAADIAPSDAHLATENSSSIPWFTLIPRTKLGPHAQVTFGVEDGSKAKRVTHVRVTMFPDGGISRVRVRGTVCA